MIRVVVLFCLYLIPYFVLAQATDTFNIRLFGAIDTEAPSTTTIASVVPVGTSQIDITWTAATDNYAVFGYVLSRDGVPIATTTALTYSDSGLTPSTTHSYTVRAFDGVPNYATSSVAAGTTTLDIPPSVATTTVVQGVESTSVRVVLERIAVTAGVATATIAVETKQPARIEIRIGQTTSYELGYFVGNTFSNKHVVPLNDLQPATTYYYEVVGYSTFGIQTSLRRGSFTTLSDAPPNAPTNISEFTAQLIGQSVTLSWALPEDFPLEGVVRIVRNHFGYPSFINDGVVVYEGSGESAVDAGVFAEHDPVFYTAFVIDPHGLISSGAVLRVSRGASVPAGFSEQTTDAAGQSPGQTMEDLNREIIPLNPELLTKEAIVVAQSNHVYTFASSSIPLSGEELFSVSIAAGSIKGDFKTVIATLGDPRGSGKSFSFLLRLNAERTAYVASIAPVRVNGQSDLQVEVYDHDALVIVRYKTQIIFSGVEHTASSTIKSFLYSLSSLLWASLLLVPFCVLWALWLLFRYREDTE